jgi:hypothetical protein
MNTVCLFVLVIFSIVNLTVPTSVVPSVQDQSQSPLPVLLVHGYYEGPEVWTEWLDNLHSDGITAFTNLGISKNCHTNILFEPQEYNWSKQILLQ